MSSAGAISVKRRWFGNSLVNLIGGLATAGVNVLLPAVVVKHLTAESFSVWNLALQMMVYVNLLSLGLQTTTARAVAHAADSGADGISRLPVIVRAARSIANGAAGVALLLVAGLVAGYPLLFPGVSVNLVGDFRTTLALFGLAAVTQILAQVDMGIFQGLHRNVVFVSVQMAVRLLTVLLVWLGVKAQQPMVVLAVLMATATALLWPSMRTAVARGLPWASEIGKAGIDRIYRRELLHYCGTLSVWSLSMLMVNSVGIVIVGRMDFVMAGPYAIAMTAASVLVGLLSAALSPLMTAAASMHASESKRHELPALLLKGTCGSAFVLNLIFIAVLVLYPTILRLWVGERFVETTGPMLVILVGAHCLRNLAAPYALMLLATGLHQRALVSALIEGVSNLLASVVLGYQFGAVGVAGGTLVGAVVGVIGTLWLNTGNTPELTPRPAEFAMKGFVLPMLLFMPAYLAIHFFR